MTYGDCYLRDNQPFLIASLHGCFSINQFGKPTMMRTYRLEFSGRPPRRPNAFFVKNGQARPAAGGMSEALGLEPKNRPGGPWSRPCRDVKGRRAALPAMPILSLRSGRAPTDLWPCIPRGLGARFRTRQVESHSLAFGDAGRLRTHGGWAGRCRVSTPPTGTIVSLDSGVPFREGMLP